MKISLITATHNSEKNITDCLQSVAIQTYKNIEYIVIDGGSTDNTLEIVKATPFVTKYISEQDKGIYDALNKGIQLATGDVIGFLHSDDLLASSLILTKVLQMFEQTHVDGVFGDLKYVSENNIDKVVRYWKSKPFERRIVKYGWMPPHPTLFLRKEVFEKHGAYDESFRIAGDYDFVLRVMLDSKIHLGYLPEVVTLMRTGGASNRSLKNIIQKSIEDYRAIRINHAGGLSTLLYKNVRKLHQFINYKTKD